MFFSFHFIYFFCAFCSLATRFWCWQANARSAGCPIGVVSLATVSSRAVTLPANVDAPRPCRSLPASTSRPPPSRRCPLRFRIFSELSGRRPRHRPTARSRIRPSRCCPRSAGTRVSGMFCFPFPELLPERFFILSFHGTRAILSRFSFHFVFMFLNLCQAANQLLIGSICIVRIDSFLLFRILTRCFAVLHINKYKLVFFLILIYNFPFSFVSFFLLLS